MNFVEFASKHEESKEEWKNEDNTGFSNPGECLVPSSASNQAQFVDEITMPEVENKTELTLRNENEEGEIEEKSTHGDSKLFGERVETCSEDKWKGGGEGFEGREDAHWKELNSRVAMSHGYEEEQQDLEEGEYGSLEIIQPDQGRKDLTHHHTTYSEELEKDLLALVSDNEETPKKQQQNQQFYQFYQIPDTTNQNTNEQPPRFNFNLQFSGFSSQGIVTSDLEEEKINRNLEFEMKNTSIEKEEDIQFKQDLADYHSFIL